MMMVPISWEKVMMALTPWNLLRAELCSCLFLSLAVMLRWEKVILKIALAILYWWYLAILTILRFHPIMKETGRTTPTRVCSRGYTREEVKVGWHPAWRLYILKDILPVSYTCLNDRKFRKTLVAYRNILKPLLFYCTHVLKIR